MDPDQPLIAIQGIAGSFHDEACAQYFPAPFTIIPCETFRDLFQVMKKRKARYAVMAIENATYEQSGSYSFTAFKSTRGFHHSRLVR